MTKMKVGLATLLAAALVGTACSGETTINNEDLEQKIADGVGAEAEFEVSGVECPEDIEAKKGTKFECTVSYEGTDLQTVAEVELTDDEGGVSFEITEVLE